MFGSITRKGAAAAAVPSVVSYYWTTKKERRGGKDVEIDGITPLTWLVKRMIVTGVGDRESHVMF